MRLSRSSPNIPNISNVLTDIGADSELQEIWLSTCYPLECMLVVPRSELRTQIRRNITHIVEVNYPYLVNKGKNWIDLMVFHELQWPTPCCSCFPTRYRAITISWRSSISLESSAADISPRILKIWDTMVSFLFSILFLCSFSSLHDIPAGYSPAVKSSTSCGTISQCTRRSPTGNFEAYRHVASPWRADEQKDYW